MAALAYSGENSQANAGPLLRPMAGMENSLAKGGTLALQSGAAASGVENSLAGFGGGVKPGPRRRVWVTLVK